MSMQRPSAASLTRVLYLDDLRVSATIAVVLLHTTSGYVDAWHQIPESLWWSANFFQSSVRWAVAVFVMISGALLLAPGPAPPLGSFYASRALRVGIPLFVWSLFYACWRHFELGRPLSPELLTRRFLAGSTHYHLYFLFAILGLYIWTPLLRKLMAQLSERVFGMALLLCWIVTLAYAANAEFSGQMSDITGSAFTKFLPFVGYYLLGHYLHSRSGESPPRYALLALLVVSMAVGMFGSAMLMERYGPGQPGRYLHSILSPNGVIFSVCIFLYVKHVKTAPADGSSMIRRSVLYRWILEGSLGIYLVHPLVLLYAQRLHRETGFLLPLGLDLPIMGLAVLGVSAALIAAIRRVPVLRWSVG